MQHGELEGQWELSANTAPGKVLGGELAVVIWGYEVSIAFVGGEIYIYIFLRQFYFFSLNRETKLLWCP